MRISDWSSDVCSSDLLLELQRGRGPVDTGVRQAQQSPPPAQPPRQQQPPQQLPPQQPVGQPPEQQPPRPEVQALPELGGVPTPKGPLVVEPSIQYSHSHVNRSTFLGVALLDTFMIGLLTSTAADRGLHHTANT